MTVMQTPQAQRTELSILEKLDKKVAGDLSISSAEGGATFRSMSEVLEFSKLMSVSQQAVPPHCRNAPGVCLGIVIQSIEWRMSPYAVASKSYVVNDRISYESQLIHAVIEQRSPVTCRLRHKFIGAGAKRQCIVWATAKGEAEPLEYTSPEFDKIQPKNSPLWKTKPDLQLYYNASRDWARMYFPDVIMGVYTEDEMRDAMPGSQAIERPRGIDGLKQTLAVKSGPEDNPADDVLPEQETAGETDQRRDESADGVDSPSTDDGTQAPYTGDASGETPEERTDREREEAASGRTRQKSAFETGTGNGVGQ